MLYDYQGNSLHTLTNLSEDDTAIIDAHNVLYMEQASTQQFVSFSVFTQEDESQKAVREATPTIEDTNTTFLVSIVLNGIHVNRIYCRSYEELLRTLSMIYPILAMMNVR